MSTEQLNQVVSHFSLKGSVDTISALGSGLINDTFKVTTQQNDSPDYVLQRINHNVFRNVDLLQSNIEAVTRHIRRKLEAQGETDIDRKVLHFVQAYNGKTYLKDEAGNYWRMMVFIPDALTFEAVTPEYSYHAGKSFAHFETMLVDLPEQLGETIPDFHNMELRNQQFQDAIAADAKGRMSEVKELVNELQKHAHEMCKAERMFREGTLPKRICHCDTKVNNMLFDRQGHVLCVIDLDTVMPSFVFSDYGDFLRTGANTVAEDDPHLDKVAFKMDIFTAFTRGYIEGSRNFLTPIERNNLPYAAALFPYMQCVRFLTDYLNGDVYYRIQYPEHNLVRAKNQLCLFNDVLRHTEEMQAFIQTL
ncbi:MAG TPA: aminoglycoside phosphotransferase family protein [Prevotella sp.]